MKRGGFAPEGLPLSHRQLRNSYLYNEVQQTVATPENSQQTLEVIQDNASTPAARQRRYDVDWVRTLALGLMIIYHGAISFQPWGYFIGFPQNNESLEGIWIVMGLINVWRIPILFLVSGMGVRFAMERRNWKQLLADRTLRILLPYVFGAWVLGIAFAIALPWLGWDAPYMIHFGHLWFLANIFLYVLLLLPILAFLKNRPTNPLFRALNWLYRWPLGIFLLALPFVVEAWLVDPEDFVLYAGTLHGLLLGMICFLLGFILVSTPEGFWPAVTKARWVTLGVGFSLYLNRLLVWELVGMPNWLMAIESLSWMLAILGFAALYLNQPSHSLTYLNKAVYPVYIVHMPVQFALAHYLLPTALPASLKFMTLIVGTLGISLLFYEFVLSKIKWLRPLFGMKLRDPQQRHRSGTKSAEVSTTL